MIVPNEDCAVAVFTDERHVLLVGRNDDFLFVDTLFDQDSLTPLGFVVADGTYCILDACEIT